MNDSRREILERLRAKQYQSSVTPPVYTKPLGWSRGQCITEFTERMQSVHGEVHCIPRIDWIDWLNRELPARGLSRVLVGNGAIGIEFSARAGDTLQIHHYRQPIDEWKGTLFNNIDVAITGASAGLAESGSLVLLPGAEEPRLMSLVPPVHIALLDTDYLVENFAAWVEGEDWSENAPTNALLISGPSKSADIEQRLAYGIHGPKQLITLLLE